MEALQSYPNTVQKSCHIRVTKTQTLKQHPRGCDPDANTLNIDGMNLEEVTNFRYMGCQTRNDNCLASKVPARIDGADATFGKLNQRGWKPHDITLQTKFTVYRAIVLPILL